MMPHYDNRRASISSSQYSSTSASSHGSLASIDEDKVLNSSDMDIVHHPTTNHPLNAPFHSNPAPHHGLSSSSSSCSSMEASPDSDYYVRNKEDLVQHLLQQAAGVSHHLYSEQPSQQQQQQQHRKSIKRPRQRKKNHHHNHTSMSASSSSNLTAAVGISRGVGLSTINPEIMQKLQLQVSLQKQQQQQQQQRKPTPQTEEERQRILARMNNYNLSVAGAGAATTTAAAVPVYRDRDRAGFIQEEEKLQDKEGMSIDVIQPFLQGDNTADVEEALPIVTDVLVCEASHNVSESLANNENDRYPNESVSDYDDDDVGNLVVVRESADKPWWARKKIGSFHIALFAIVFICLGGLIGIVAHTSIKKDNDNSSDEVSDYQDILSDDEFIQYNNELNALFRLYRLSGGESWNDRRGWEDAERGHFLPENHYCSWYGIKCSEDYFNITEIDLAGNNLAGTTEDMGESLTNLLSLRLLNLASNSIQGNISGLSKYLFAMKNLRIVNLRDNQITGTVSGPICETAIFVDCEVECECCERRC